MTLFPRPNNRVATEDDPATKLTYVAQVAPSPLTVSQPGESPTYGALTVLITNNTGADVAVSVVRFTVTVGEPGVEGSPLMPSTAGVEAHVSDKSTWSFGGPSSPVESGTADFVLAPVTGGTATLPAGASIYVKIYHFHTTSIPGTSEVQIAETLAGGGEPIYTVLAVSTFPAGFYFGELTVNVAGDSELVPVAQVANPAQVTLTWNSSVVEAAKHTVFWSSAIGGEQYETATLQGKWTLPADKPLTADTVFVVVVNAETSGGEPLIASLVAAVSVQNPDLVSSTATVTGALSAGSAAVDGGLSAGSATVSGALSAGSAEVGGALSAGSVVVSKKLSAGSAAFGGGISANHAELVGGLFAGYANLLGPLGALSATFKSCEISPTENAGLIVRGTPGHPPIAYFENRTYPGEQYVPGLMVIVGDGECAFYSEGHVSAPTITHLETRNGHRVVSPPLALRPEVQLTGRARLSAGHATVELEPEPADMIFHSDEDPYRVLLTPAGTCNGLAVTARGPEGFEVTELQDGSSNAEFDWLLIAPKRRALDTPEPAAHPASLPQPHVPMPDESKGTRS